MFKHIFLISLFATAVCINDAIAQDATAMEVEVSDNDRERERDRIINSPGEMLDTRYTNPGSPVADPKDTVVSSPASAKTNTIQQPKLKTEKPVEKPAAPQKAQGEKVQKSQDDSILSFNFLYFIIEKYKLQDIVD